MKGHMVARGASTALALILTVAPIHTARANTDGEIQELKQQLEAALARIEALEAQQVEIPPEPAVAPVPENVVTGGDLPGSFKLPGTNTSVKIGGYVKGDLIYDVDSDLGDSFAVSAIPAEGAPDDDREGNFRAHARQTRVNITTVTPTDFGEAQTFIEGDFFGSGGDEIFSNSTSFRLRHAYGSLGPALIGQTWSNFMYLESYPDTVDFFGPVGIPFVRQGQLRYTFDATDNLEIAVSAENSELTGQGELAVLDEDGVPIDPQPQILPIGGVGGGRGDDDLQFGIDTIPDFTARATYSDDWGSVNLSGVGRLLSVDSGAGIEDEEFGWGVLAAGVLNVGEFIPALGDDSILANFTYGDGVGRYIINGFQQDAFLGLEGNLDTIESWGVAAAYTHHWTDKLRSNLVYGHYEVEDTFASERTESLDSLHVNAMWTPTDRTQFGLEWVYGQRDFVDSSLDNNAQRVQLGAWFFF